MNAGLTCVAAKIAFERANGFRNGCASWPYPPEIARRVDHASNAAPACPAAINPYQTFRCLGVSPGRRLTDLTGSKGCAAERNATGSTSGFTFGCGAEGKAGTAVASLEMSREAV